MQDVSISVRILSLLSKTSNGNPACKFAVRSEGHMAISGNVNINYGVTIDMSALNAITVSAEKTPTSIEPGARWEHVYLKLNALGPAVAGGRAAQVGVGGLSIRQ